MWDKISRPDEARTWTGDIPIHHRYTAGVAGEAFFRAMRDEKRLLASRCPACGDLLLPAKMYCERCFVRTSEMVPVEGPGVVRTYTVLHVSLDEEPLAEPVIAAFVGWEGVRGGLLHRLGEVSSGGVHTGMMVEPVWAEERTGGLEDITHFRPSNVAGDPLDTPR